MSVISFIIVENFGKVSAFVVRKLRLLKVLRSMISGLCCRGLCNICSLFYFIFILIYKNKLYWKIYWDDHSSLSYFFPFPHGVEYLPRLTSSLQITGLTGLFLPLIVG